MKIALVTTLPRLSENKRIEQEIKSLGHDFQLISLHDFGFTIKNNQLNVDALDTLDADLVILRGVFNAQKPIALVVSDLRKRGIKVFDNNFLNHKYSINKIADLIKLGLRGIPMPNTTYARSFDQFESAANQIGFPVIVKSARMGKGARIYKLDSEAELKKLLTQFQKEERKAKSYLIQEFIPYEYDLRILIVGSDVFAMHRIPAEGEFRANFSLGGDVELFNIDEKTRTLAKSALHAIDMTVGGVDVLITKDNTKYILEVNHTAGMVGMEKATGENITKMYVQHAIKHAQ